MSVGVGPLQSRVARLEQAVSSLQGRAGGGEALSPNYLTVDGQGRTGASFSGFINALGLVLPSTPLPAQQATSVVTWDRQSDGAQVARLFGGDQAGGELLQGEARGQLPGDFATASWLTRDSAGNFSGIQVTSGTLASDANVEAVASDPAHFGQALVINSQQQSDFVQNVAPGNVAVQFGGSTLTWPGGSTVSNTIAQPFTPGFLPVSGIVLTTQTTSAGQANFPNMLTINNVQFTALAVEVGGAAPAAGVTASLFWLAWGAKP